MSKENKGLQDKLKNFFKGLNKGPRPPRPGEYLILTEEFENDLRPESPLPVRLKAVKEINEVAKVRRLENFAVEKLWELLQDLLKPEVARETRHVIFGLFTTLCQFQLDKSGYLRTKFFNFIKGHNVEEDAGPKFEFLKALTDNGRDVSYFDDRMAPLMLSWMGGPHSLKKTGDFMIFLNNFLKFNQSLVDQEILASIIQNVCYIACTSASRQDTLECLKALETVFCYGSLPSSSLSTFLATLCRTVNVEFLCQQSWKMVRNLLHTDLGHSGLMTMCDFMKIVERNNDDYTVVRGAVFFVGVALWGSNMVRTLKYSPSMVLSSFAEALHRKQIYISYEVMLRIQDYVRYSGDTIQATTWESVLEIIETVVDDIQGGEWKKDTTNHGKILKVVGDTLDAVEALIDKGGFCGALHRFYAVIENARTFRPESSIAKLMQYKHKNLLQCTVPNWLTHLILFCERNVREEQRPNLKVKAIKIVHEVAITQLETHEDELIEKVILQYFKTLEQEPEIQVRQAGVQFIVQFLMESTSKKCHDVLSILEKVVHRPFDHHSPNIEPLRPNDAIDISTAVNGLIDLFQKKIYQLPSTVAIYCYRILVRLLSHHYKRANILDYCSSIRYNIFSCFMKIRANSMYHLGFATSDDPESPCYRFSPYLAVDHRDGSEKEDSKSDQGDALHSISSGSSLASLTNQFTSTHGVNPTASPPILHPVNGTTAVLALLYANANTKDLPTPVVTSISLTQACKLVVTCLKKERDWKIIELVLSKLPRVLENKALVLSKHGNDIDYLATALSDMMTDRSALPLEVLRNAPTSNFRTEFQAYFYPILTSLISYHSHLEPVIQKKVVKCLELGLTSRCSRICILALSICVLEMKDTMHKMLPEVLMALSKISPKVNIAIPVLEFLSTLIHLPRVFASFVQEQYMSIFAIALPYTNPFKFNQYTVSLAHHVIAMWFLKCRLSFRKGFVSFIIKGLESNIWTPFEEETRKNDRELQNEDSSNRKRSSSLTDQTFKRRERPISGHHPAQQHHPSGHHSSVRYHPVLDWKPPMDKGLMTFHQELTETCVDLMARYAFADCAALPTPFQSSSLLLTGGMSQTWLSDNRIITITTSGCTQKELRDGLCDKCWLLCRKIVDSSTGGLNRTDEKKTSETMSSNESVHKAETNEFHRRRRHKSAFAGSSVLGRLSRPDSLEDQGVFPMNGKAKDDLQLDNKLGQFGEGLTVSTTEISLKPKLDHATYCTCWCQGWAEVHIRRPTGNTSWMMRVQNQMGNQASWEFPIKELSAMYLNSIFTMKGSNSVSDPTSAQSSPTIQNADPMIGSSKITVNPQDSNSRPLQNSKSPPSPLSPGSPGEEYTGEVGLKNPVRRSNSSPEMCSSWKAPFMNQQRDIREQDEDESGQTGQTESDNKGSSQPTDLPSATNAPTTAPANNSQQTSNELTTATEKESEVNIQKGNASPFQCYDIPEENLQLQVDKAAEDLTPRRRDRMSTISVMSPARPGNQRLRRMTSTDISSLTRPGFGGLVGGSSTSGGGGESGIRSGISPGFIFLQLCAQGILGNGNSKPLLLPNSEATKKSLKVLDYIPPYETHKIGVVYVGPGQATNETLILQNQYGSSRYREFLNGLGKLIKLSQVDPQKVFLGGLSRDGGDGAFAAIWQDDVMQVIFHAATLMPNKPNDPNGNAKKCHIGNDYVAIVYNNSDEDYDISTIKGQFLYACVVIQPLDHRTNRVIVKAKPGLADLIGHTEPKIVSDKNLPIMARQWALHSNLASHIFQNMQRPGADLYASNWLERLRHIKRLRTRLTQEAGHHHHHHPNQHSVGEESQLEGGGNTNNSGSGNNTTAAAAGLTSRRSFNVDDFTEFV